MTIPDPNKKRLCLLYRKPVFFFSMERIFNQLEPLLGKEMIVQRWIAPYSSPRKIFGNWRAVRKCRADLFHITGEIHYMALALRGKPVLLTIHDCGFLYGAGRWKTKLLKWLFLDMPVRRSGLVTTISEKTREDILRFTGCPADKVVVIPNPVNDKIYHLPATFRKEMPVILFIGSTPNKNLERVIPALENIPCQLSIVGEISGKALSMLSQYNIRFMRKVKLTDEKIAAEYAACDIVLFPSLLEGFGLPIVEGQKAGRPVITSDLSPMKEVAGGAACLVDPYSISSIRDGILKVINDEGYREKLIEDGFSNIRRFEPEQIARKYLDCYEKLLIGKNGYKN